MTQLFHCRIEDEIGQVTKRILSENELRDMVAEKLGLFDMHDRETARIAAAFYSGPIWNEGYQIGDWVIEWTCLP
ncbi:hypothetical protein [Rhizobium leguminosarum]|uniref:hypothetical protein n=1 Tax=Rhizobium leguminosarum TaxID=384 RepID=UPI00186117A0|nr:hypothetical protein [Rhizobium leguminosarum]MBY3025436.1 hypothetical protein [Rhizobium leguminosarum]QNH71756.1 hypothetical protein V1VFAS_034 [Rhizobium phage V1VFA-S]